VENSLLMDEPDYQILPFPPERQIVIDAGRWASRRHISYGLAEIDVTRPRQVIQYHKERTGERLSFTGYIIYCLAQAIQVDRRVQAYRDWQNRLIVFDDVDVVTMIETRAGEVALPHIIRSANRKTYRQINDEIHRVQSQPASSQQSRGLTRMGAYFPRFLRDIYVWYLRKNPHRLKQISGTVIVTSVGMFSKGAGWALTYLPWHTLGLALGSIVERLALVDGQVQARQHLCVTISVDHDVVDGAPAARFGQVFIELVEGGQGLEEFDHE
jgi:pyruvate/2-oxoglutarate dehydrogenase complex dihydrolipoamide acyltransferase (E2) component